MDSSGDNELAADLIVAWPARSDRRGNYHWQLGSASSNKQVWRADEDSAQEGGIHISVCELRGCILTKSIPSDFFFVNFTFFFYI